MNDVVYPVALNNSDGPPSHTFDSPLITNGTLDM